MNEADYRKVAKEVMWCGFVESAERILREHFEPLLAVADKQARSTLCSYCGLITEVETMDIELKRKAAIEHILVCEKRPEIQFIDLLVAKDKELADLRSPMECGHVKANFHLVEHDCGCGEVDHDVHYSNACVACEERDAAVAAAIDRVAEHWPVGELGTLTDFRCSCGATLEGSAQNDRIASWKEHIRSLITAPQAAALELVRAEARLETTKAYRAVLLNCEGDWTWRDVLFDLDKAIAELEAKLKP